MTIKLNGSTAGSVALDAPASTTGNADINFKLPVADGSANQVMKTDGSGNLSFASAGSGAQKAIRVITGSLGFPAGAAVNLATANIQAGEQVTGLSTAVSQGKSLDVFVNGQLLVSGSEAERAAATRDYAVADTQVLKFAFALEADDIVQVIKR